MAVEAPERHHQSETRLPIDAHAGVPGWLGWLRPLLPACEWLGVIEQGATAGTFITHSYPVDAKAPAAVMLVARKALVSGRVTSVKLNPKASSGTVLFAIPLRQASKPFDRVLIFSGPPLAAKQREACVNLCRWASTWLYPPDRVTPVSPDSTLASLLACRSPVSMAIAIVNTLKRIHNCQRVSLAIRHCGSSHLQLLAMSDQSRIDARKVLPSQIVSTMQEMLDSKEPRLFHGKLPDYMEAQYPASFRLFEDQGRLSSIACVHAETATDACIEHSPPADATIVVVLLERAAESEFDQAEQESIQLKAIPACSLLVGRVREHTGLLQRCRQQAGLWLDVSFWRTMTRRRLFTIFGALLAAVVLLWPVPHRISARALIEAQDLQVLVAPQAGFIASSHARAGDRVSKGQLLATLDDRDLTLAVGKWHSEANKNDQARDLALASRDRVELARLRADATRIEAEQLLVDRQLSRAQLRAPFDGVVLSGDLSQQLGSSVVQGDTLFTVGSSDAYRLILDVDERDVGLVKPGQATRVRLAAQPNRIWEATIEAVLPVATSTDEGNVFQVPAQLNNKTDAIRPGMEGVAKLQVGTQSLAWVYTRRLRESVKIWLWHLGLIR
ncbi:efflux RND transporter periplasmic adaptor subunit [Granulosicoccus antarcticus]|uniref:Uncharacterized protein n=1 Tax=Granulosicoccus antarcticus IMCC3135 TaxID=1192854 RepID=A0A2Z2NVJ1_9GAMM|nr:efflux RND transporter periplasmic adaptor subunit [Granulosicoccus antarcticus]ASJ75349.1 hypothetical protein IMCC3135_26470 [Granulosicoccus antarcticus IMCC3135]